MIKVCAPAKINLTLEITGRREDGYHMVHTIMQTVSLYETAEVWKREQNGIELLVEGADLPVNESNTAYKAAIKFFSALNMEAFGLGVRLIKQVPIGAGLAGGSADAAAVLVALNELTGASLPVGKLCEIGATVGADVPFCILGGTALGTGTGTTLTPLPPMPDCSIVISKPFDSISTAEAYRLIDNVEYVRRSTGAEVERAIHAGDLSAIAHGLSNDFDTVTKLAGVIEIKRIMNRQNTMGCQMTGSGSAVFGLFADNDTAQSCAQELRKQYSDVFVCKPDSKGARII